MLETIPLSLEIMQCPGRCNTQGMQYLYYTQEEASWHQGLKNLKKWRTFFENLQKFVKNLRVYIWSTKSFSS